MKLNTITDSNEAREFLSELFADQIGTRVFEDYIQSPDKLAGDFAYTLARWLVAPQKKLCECCRGCGEVATGTTTYQGHNQPPEPDLDACPECGGESSWYKASDIDSLVRDLDLVLNGEADRAINPRLSDIVAQISNLVGGSPIKLAGFCNPDDIGRPEGVAFTEKGDLHRIALYTMTAPGEVSLMPRMLARANEVMHEQTEALLKAAEQRTALLLKVRQLQAWQDDIRANSPLLARMELAESELAIERKRRETDSQLHQKGIHEAHEANIALAAKADDRAERIRVLEDLLAELVKMPRIGLPGNLHERVVAAMNVRTIPPVWKQPDPIIAVLKACLEEGTQPTFSGGDLKHLISLLEA